MTINAETIEVPNGTLYRAEGRNEPVFITHNSVTTVIDGEGDVWVENPHTNLYYLPEWGETPNDADTTLAEIAEDYGIDSGEPEPVSTEPTPRYKRGDITINRLSGREALVLGSNVHRATGMVLYTVIEKGFTYPAGCGPTKGSGTMPEFVLDPSGQPPFSEPEVTLLALVYSL